MKIYRAIVRNNNGDSNEWEEWFDCHSEWYASRELAEKHLPMLNKLADAMRYKCRGNYSFIAEDPIIEEHEIAEVFTPIDFTERQYEEKMAFEEFSYIPYEGPHSISSKELCLSCFPNPSWCIDVLIGEEEFEICFSTYGDEYGKFSCHKSTQKDSKFFRYTPEVREELLSVVEEYAKVISPYFKKYREESDALDNWDEYDFKDPRRYEGWEAQRVSEMQNIEYLLKNTHLILSESTVSSIKREIEDDRGRECPKYKEALTRLLPYGGWKPEEYPTEEYGDLAIKLREALNK